MRLALDTNVLAYAEGVNGNPRKKSALEIIEKLPAESTFLPVQALGELFHVLVRKAGRRPERARASRGGAPHGVLGVSALSTDRNLARRTRGRDRFGGSPWFGHLGLDHFLRRRRCRMPPPSFGRPASGIYLERSDCRQSLFLGKARIAGVIAGDVSVPKRLLFQHDRLYRRNAA